MLNIIFKELAELALLPGFWLFNLIIAFASLIGALLRFHPAAACWEIVLIIFFGAFYIFTKGRRK